MCRVRETYVIFYTEAVHARSKDIFSSITVQSDWKCPTNMLVKDRSVQDLLNIADPTYACSQLIVICYACACYRWRVKQTLLFKDTYVLDDPRIRSSGLQQVVTKGWSSSRSRRGSSGTNAAGSAMNAGTHCTRRLPCAGRRAAASGSSSSRILIIYDRCCHRRL